MEKPEIVSGLKQAIERGYSLEQAKKSFVNAGYNYEDVEDSAKTFSGLITNFPQQISQPQNPQAFQNPQYSQYPQQPQIPQNPQIPQLPQIQQSTRPQTFQYENKKSKKTLVLIIILIVVLALLIGILGASLFFKDWFLETLKSIGINLG